jgi:hypothetical protein
MKAFAALACGATAAAALTAPPEKGLTCDLGPTTNERQIGMT